MQFFSSDISEIDKVFLATKYSVHKLKGSLYKSQQSSLIDNKKTLIHIQTFSSFLDLK